jgi:hypothetical protein
MSSTVSQEVPQELVYGGFARIYVAVTFNGQQKMNFCAPGIETPNGLHTFISLRF